MTGLSIAVIDDHPLFREGVRRSLGEINGFQIVGEGCTKEDAIRIAHDHRPDVILMDISMPGGGLDAISPILDHFPDQKIIMLTVSERSDDVTKALNSGAKAYVLKGVGSRALAENNPSCRLWRGLRFSGPIGPDAIGSVIHLQCVQ